jgi:hypothetical protein
MPSSCALLYFRQVPVSARSWTHVSEGRLRPHAGAFRPSVLHSRIPAPATSLPIAMALLWDLVVACAVERCSCVFS